MFVNFCGVFVYSVPGLFAAAKAAFPEGASAFLPIDTGAVPFNGTCETSTAVSTYTKYEKVLDSLPKPVLVACKSGARASAVVTAYAGCKSRSSFETMRGECQAQGIHFRMCLYSLMYARFSIVYFVCMSLGSFNNMLIPSLCYHRAAILRETWTCWMG